MKFTALVSLFSLAAIVTALPSEKRDAFSDAALRAHNAARAHYGANALTYNTALASGAATYAAQCHWGHSGGSYGENLAASTSAGYTITNAVDGWMAEASSYNWNNPGFSSATGHFTQVVWRGTTSVGCATHRCTTGSPFGSGDWTYILCRYDPPGNYLGQFPANVGTYR